MPINIIGPMKMRKFERNRNPTKMIWIQSCGVLSTWLMKCPMCAAAPGHVASGLFLATRISQTRVMKPVKKMPTRK